jgi:TRAP-type transport system periplasmic protein
MSMIGHRMRFPILGMAGLALSLVAAFSGGEARSEEVKWIGGGIQAPNTPASLGAIRFTELVKERSNGRLIFEHFDAAMLGPANQQMEAIAAGTQQFYISSGIAASNLVPELGILDVAFLYRDSDHVEAFNHSDMREEIDRKLIDDFGIRVIANNWFRMPRYFLHRSEFITSVEGLAGVRVRSPNLPINQQNWKCLDANPVVVAYQEQYLALSQGVVEMTEISGEQLYGMKLHEVAPYITDAYLGYPQASVYVSEPAFQALSPEDQELVVQAAQDAGDYQSELVRERFQPEWEKVMAEGGKFKALTPEERRGFQEKMTECAPEFIEAGIMPEGWWERILALK